MRNLTYQEEAFCRAYLAEGGDSIGSGVAAYRSAYNSKTSNNNTLYSQASRILAKPKVAARLKELREEAQKKAKFKVFDVLRHWVMIATADPNELMQYRRLCCRYCHGKNFERQSTEHEYALQCADAISKGREKMPPEPRGGFGFNANHDPHPECPVCFGRGVEDVYFADTRKLKGAAKLLYAGVKKKRGGVEVVTRSQDAALENIAKYLGMFNGKNSGDSEGEEIPIGEIINDPVEASKIYQRIMKGG